MKQLTQNEFKKDNVVYKNIASPTEDIDHEQIQFMAVDEFGNLQISTDGANYETISSDATIKDLKTLQVYNAESDLPNNPNTGDKYAVLTNGNLPINVYEFDGVEWQNLGYLVNNTLVFNLTDNILYLYNENTQGYFTKTSYTKTSELTNDANFATTSDVQGVQNQINTINNTLNNKVNHSIFSKTIYATNLSGVDVGIPYSNDTLNSEGIPQRDINGQILVPETPTENKHAASKKYVDTGLSGKQATLSQAQQDAVDSGIDSTKVSQIATNTNNITTNANDISALQTALGNKLDKVSGTTKVYATDLGGNQTTLEYSPNADANKLVQRYAAGQILVPNTPTSSNHATSKNYVDSGLSGKQDALSTAQMNAVNSGADSTNIGQISTNTSDIATINGKIPSQASTSNQLADKDFVNSSINAFASFYITKNANGDPFATKAELTSATTFYSGGTARVPTTNDYAIVLADESKTSGGVDPSTRYTYQGGTYPNGQWEYQYTINVTPLTSAQLQALNSGITTSLVTQIGTNETNITNLGTTKQNVINSSNKINADYVEDGTTNKVFTATEQTKLSGIESGAEVNDLEGVQINGTDLSISGKKVNIVTNTAYDATSNKIATMSDIPTQASDINAQETLVSGTNIKTINNQSILGSGNLTIQAGQQVDVQVNGTSIVSNDVANIVTETAYDATSNKIATMSDVPDISTKMDKSNPTGTGSLSINRKANTTVGTNSVALGYNNTASGIFSFAEGFSNTSSNNCSHAEGSATTASGAYSHAEGNSTTASLDYAHAEGVQTTASGLASHAENFYTKASGQYSHAQGVGTTAQRKSQHTFGEYNVLDNTGTTTTHGDYIEIVGNGTADNARSNARTLDWSGNQELAGYSKSNGVKNTGAYKIGSNDKNVASISGTQITLGDSSTTTKIAGSGTRPTYNNGDLALYSDIPSIPVTSVNNKTGAVSLTASDVGAITSSDLLAKIYPVGSVYMTIENTSPAFFLGGTWTQIGANYALWTATSGAGNTISSGLPNITGKFGRFPFNVGAQQNYTSSSGALYYTQDSGVNESHNTNSSSASQSGYINFDASRSSSIYGNSTTVQPPAYKVYAWRRIA